jgi:hypothetical protein
MRALYGGEWSALQAGHINPGTQRRGGWVSLIFLIRATAGLDVFETLVPAKDRTTIPMTSNRFFSHYADLAMRMLT